MQYFVLVGDVVTLLFALHSFSKVGLNAQYFVAGVVTLLWFHAVKWVLSDQNYLLKMTPLPPFSNFPNYHLFCWPDASLTLLPFVTTHGYRKTSTSIFRSAEQRTIGGLHSQSALNFSDILSYLSLTKPGSQITQKKGHQPLINRNMVSPEVQKVSTLLALTGLKSSSSVTLVALDF